MKWILVLSTASYLVVIPISCLLLGNNSSPLFFDFPRKLLTSAPYLTTAPPVQPTHILAGWDGGRRRIYLCRMAGSPHFFMSGLPHFFLYNNTQSQAPNTCSAKLPPPFALSNLSCAKFLGLPGSWSNRALRSSQSASTYRYYQDRPCVERRRKCAGVLYFEIGDSLRCIWPEGRVLVSQPFCPRYYIINALKGFYTAPPDAIPGGKSSSGGDIPLETALP